MKTRGPDRRQWHAMRDIPEFTALAKKYGLSDYRIVEHF
jgi:hypothetical protein